MAVKLSAVSLKAALAAAAIHGLWAVSSSLTAEKYASIVIDLGDR